MKILILILALFSTLGSQLYSQGNLQFNQVKTITPGMSYTVPAGKVLKIEGINFGNTTVCIPKTDTGIDGCQPGYGQNWQNYNFGIYASIVYLTIGNINFSTPSFNGMRSPGTYCGTTSFDGPCWNYDFGSKTFNCPIWLEAGKTVTVHAGVASILISAVEFNIIP